MKSTLVGAGLLVGLLGVFVRATGPVPAPAWTMNATVIEACSCTMFCPCYFSPRPTAHSAAGGHGEGHFCRFNNVYKVNRGQHGAAKLDGATFWLAGDLGDDFSDGEFDWAVLHYAPEVTKAQRDAIGDIVGHLFPMRWKSFELGKDAPIEWTAGRDRATARLDGGKAGEVVLARFKGMTDEPVVIRNLRYFGAPRNDGFIMMPNEIETYKLGPKAYEFKGTNGFMLTLDIDADSAPPKVKGM